MIRNFYDTEGNYWVSRDVNLNGHDYVDLDLPSGTLWAWKNVGASSPDESGLYFQWGDTQGYTKGQIGTDKGKKEFSLDGDDYKWYESGNAYDLNVKFKKYNTEGARLDLEDDAAHVNMGGSWHMPTIKQINELLDFTNDGEWGTQYGVEGMFFRSTMNGNEIFIPAAGCAEDGSVRNNDVVHYGGYIWSNELMIGDNYEGRYLGLDSAYIREESYACSYSVNRCCGFSVRGVIG